MKFRIWTFLFAALICDQAWSRPRIIASPVSRAPRVVAPVRYATSPTALSPNGVRYGTAGKMGQLGQLGPVAMTGYGGISAPIVPLAQAEPTTTFSDLLKGGLQALGAHEAKPIPPSQNPTYTPGPGYVPVYRDPREIRVREQTRAANVPQCMGESAGALLIGTKACNAVYLGDGLAMTNAHCACGPNRNVKPTYVAVNGSKSEPHGCQANPVCNSSLDYAIISCPSLKNKVTPARIANRYPTFTERIYIPTHDFGKTITKRINIGPMTEFFASVRGGSQRSMKSYAVTIKGNSGSGVHSADNEVLGLVWGGEIKGPANTLFTPMVNIVDAMKRTTPQVAARIEAAQRSAQDNTGREQASACREQTVAPLAQAGRD